MNSILKKAILKYKNEKSGSISPFLIITLSVLLIFLFGLIDIFKICDAKCRLKLCCLIGIKSCMADYNSELKRDYGLYAFVYQNKFEIENEIKKNITQNINSIGLNKTNVYSVKIANSVNLSNRNEIIRQIKNIYSDKIINTLIDDILYNEEDIEKIHEEKSRVVTEEEYNNISNYAELDNRDEIENKINNLNNDDIVIEDYMFNESGINKIKFENAKNESNELINKIKNMKIVDYIAIEDYICEYFDYLTCDKEFEREKIFDCEIEFILGGSNSQNENIKRTKNKILLLLYPEKLKEIYNDETKRTEAELIAEAVSGWWASELGVRLTKNIILSAWAYQEADNEYQKIINGEKIYVELLQKEMTYLDFLKLLLFVQNMDDKVDNLIKLIDVNMKKYNIMFSMETSLSKIEVEVLAKEQMQFMIRKCILSEMRFTDEIDIKEKCTCGY